MTDIPGTILTAIRNAIDAAVMAERERCAKVAETIGERLYREDLASSIAVSKIASEIREGADQQLGRRKLTPTECQQLTQEFGGGWLRSDFPQRDAVRARVTQMVKESIGWSSDPPTETSCISVVDKLRAKSEAEPFRCPACGQGQNYAAPVMLMYPLPTPGQKLLVQWGFRQNGCLWEGEEPYEILAEPYGH